MSRDYRFDYLKCILIYLVVTGHFLILGHEGISTWLYRSIYAVHMPMFIFITGYFSKRLSIYSPKLFNRIISFIILNIMFILVKEWISVIFGYGKFNPNFIIQNGASWYLLVSAIYCLLTPMLLKFNNHVLFLVCLLSTFISVKYGEKINIFCLTKVLSFLPMYVCGLKIDFEKIKKPKTIYFFIAIICLLFIVSLTINKETIHPFNFYYQYSYDYLNQSLWKTFFIRILLIFESISILISVFFLLPNKKTKVSIIGSHTLSIYILHILFRDVFEYIFMYDTTDTLFKMIFIIILSGFIVVILSKKPFIYIENIMKIQWIK